MPPDNRLPVVLCWHMHQPEYRDLSTGVFSRPWTYLHATKDYTDMAAHLEAHPRARAVVNFSPVLLEQLGVYEQRLKGALEHGSAVGDPLLDALLAPAPTSDPDRRDVLLRACLRLNKSRMVQPFAQFASLIEVAEAAVVNGVGAACFSDAFMHDLVTWYHLAWLGSTVRRRDARAAALIDHGSDYGASERRNLAALILDCIAGLRGRYGALASAGRVEISVTPWGHPILPLLIDFHAARETLPDAPLPRQAEYPEGAERVRWHLRRARESIEDYFGVSPLGCWPSEGALSERALDEIAAAGFRWTATGQGVLTATLDRAGRHGETPRMYERGPNGLRLFARDDELSDRIGFVYSSWDPVHAVSDLERALVAIAERAKGHSTIVSIIMDGENAWEHYPDNGAAFLSLLYERLGGHDALRLTTFAEASRELEAADLPAIVAGSWVYGTLSTWIGEEAKNRLWDLLVQAKRCHDRSTHGDPDAEAAMLRQRQLAVCEGSDWFWWPSDHQPRETVSEFESLFGMHLLNLYRGAGAEPPADVVALRDAARARYETGPVMRPGVPPAADAG